MKYSVKRNEELTEVKRISVQIGKTRYKLTESIDGKLCINKSDGDGEDCVMVFPRSSNEIEIK